MSYGGEGADIDFETARGRDWPSIRQFNVFVENRLGGLLNVVSKFETTDIRIVSLMIVDSTDCVRRNGPSKSSTSRASPSPRATSSS
jgi:hypothetical protein